MRISVNIPTYKRSTILDTFKLLPKANYWVHDFEVEDYKRENPGIKIKALSDDDKGNIATVRNRILLSENKHDVTVQIDDDVSHLIFYEGRTLYKLETESDVMFFIRKGSLLAREWEVKLWGINVAPDKQNYREYTPFSLLSYVSGSFSCFMKGNDLFYDERFSLKEDYDMTIQQINKYRRVLRFNKFSYVKKGAEQVGGCATYRNVKKEMMQLKMLEKKWGSDIVKMDQSDRSHSTNKKHTFDINPIVSVPISGV